jgi:hypothetical protein
MIVHLNCEEIGLMLLGIWAFVVIGRVYWFYRSTNERMANNERSDDVGGKSPKYRGFMYGRRAVLFARLLAQNHQQGSESRVFHVFRWLRV